MLYKSAIIKAAQKFTAKGQIDKAIAEWEKLLQENPDGNVYNIIGDLYLRKNAKHGAIEAFTKAADIFKKDGFYLKAMALYKKILNISPSKVDVLISLAELNVGKNLMGAANDNFLAAAQIYIKEGTIEKALDLYKKMLKLTPDNADLRMKIGDLYIKSGLNEEAINEYLSIASSYLREGEHEKAQKLYNRIIGLDPQNIASFIGLSKIAENEDNIKEAYEYLNKAMPFAKDNNDFLSNYSRLAIKTNNTDNAKWALTKLIEAEPSNNRYKRILGNIYLKEGLLEKAWKELLPSIDEALNAERWGEVFELLNNFREIEPVEVKRRLITIYRGENDKEALISELRELAGIFNSQGFFQDALQSYKELLGLNPSDEAAREKIKQLEESIGVEEVLSEIEVLTEKDTTSSSIAPSEIFEEKLTEADFYAQQGFKDEAIKIYEELLSVSPDNEDLKKRIEALKPKKVTETSQVKIIQPEEEIPASTTESDVMEAFHKLKKGVDEEVGEKDYETRYNLGIAYKEMGLLDDAIKEFQIVAKDPKRTVQNSSMLALCYMDKNLYPLAIEEFKKVIEAMAPTDDGYLGVKFDLAEAYVKNREYNTALKQYIEIYAQNPNFKDIKLKIENVKALLSEETDGKPKSKKGRVSYI